MPNRESNKLRSGFYDPERSKASTNVIVSIVFVLMFSGAFWYSLTTTLDNQQRQHCAQGWQRACEGLK
jgi:hypothetical protein